MDKRSLLRSVAHVLLLIGAFLLVLGLIAPDPALSLSYMDELDELDPANKTGQVFEGNTSDFIPEEDNMNEFEYGNLTQAEQDAVDRALENETTVANSSFPSNSHFIVSIDGVKHVFYAQSTTPMPAVLSGLGAFAAFISIVIFIFVGRDEQTAAEWENEDIEPAPDDSEWEFVVVDDETEDSTQHRLENSSDRSFNENDWLKEDD